MKPLRLAITAGEPAGIGPDLCIQIAQQPQQHELVVIADPKVLTERAQQLGLDLTLIPFDADAAIEPNKAGQLKILAVNCPQAVQAGQLNSANSNYVLETLALATDTTLADQFNAIITAPVHKGIINDAGIVFSGHTEFLEERTGSKKVVMMLATEGLKVALVTTHLPLRQVPDAITPELFTTVIKVLHQDLQTCFAIEQPKILVAGLNPHAGEGGYLGDEEINCITPCLDKLRAEGMNLIGPLPADTLFTEKYLADADAALAIYHDQGLPVLKYKSFGNAANITLGLPIIRTSVDHGTALDLAGTGKANAGSLIYAINYAAEMANAKGNNR